MKLLTFLILIIFWTTLLNCQAQNEKLGLDDSLQLEIFNCRNDTFELKLPKGWIKTDIFNYEEGFIQSYIYSDLSTISILCGANAELNMTENKDNSLYYRKSNVGKRTITYERVRKERLIVFDYAFDKLEKK